MDKRKRLWLLAPLLVAVLFWGGFQSLASGAQSNSRNVVPQTTLQMQLSRVTNAQRRAAAAKLAEYRKSHNTPLSAALGALTNGKNPLTAGLAALSPAVATLTPNATPDYYNVPNYANSPLPGLDSSGNPIPGTGIRKFVDALPGLGIAGANDLGQYLPVAAPDTTSYPGSDFYAIALVEYTERLHADLPPTKLRGYVQLNSNGTSMSIPPSYLGPMIVAQKDRPVRVEFINKLPTGQGDACSCRSTRRSWAPVWVRTAATTRRIVHRCTSTAESPRGSATARRISGSRRRGRSRHTRLA